MAKKKQQGMYLLLAAAGIGVFIYTRKKREKDLDKAIAKEIVATETAKAVQGYFSVG